MDLQVYSLVVFLHYSLQLDFNITLHMHIVYMGSLMHVCTTGVQIMGTITK